MRKPPSITRLLAAMSRCTTAPRPKTNAPGPLGSPGNPVCIEPMEPRLLLSANPILGDANLDGLVDDHDITLIKQNWNAQGNAGALPGDVNGDGFVGMGDLNLVLGSPDFNAVPVTTNTPAVSANDLVEVNDPLYTDFNGQITGNWLPTFDRDLETIDPDGNLVPADTPRWGDAVGTGTFQPWEQVLETDSFLINIGQGPGADGQWLSVWYHTDDRTLIAYNHDLSEFKTLDIEREGRPDWLAAADQEADTLFVPKTGQIVPGGLWMVYLQREADYGTGPGDRDWTPVGTSFGVAQEITYDNIFDQTRSVLDSPYAQGLIDSRTGLPYENIRGQEWALSLTPIVVNDRVEKVWWTFTDYMQDPKVDPVKPGGSTWVILAERDAVGDHYTLRQPRLIEQQEDPLGPDLAFEHRHSAITVVHETGEVDVVVASGDTAPHAFLKRYRIDDPANYETSTLTVQDTGFLGITGEASGKLISFQVGSAPDKILAATDGRDEGILEITIPLSMNDPAEVRSVIGRGFNKAPAMTVNLAVAKPWERSGYAVSVRPFLTLEEGLIPALGTSIFYSEDGEDWVEMASNIDNTELVFHDDWLVIAGAPDGTGIRKTQLDTVDAMTPLLISPGGTQRLNSTLTEHISYDETDIVFLEKVNGVWVDDGVPLSIQPPSFGPVVKVSRPDTAENLSLSWLYLAGTDADFEAGGFVSKSWVMPVAGYSPFITIGHSTPGYSGILEPAQPTANEDWLPVLTWSNFEPYEDGSDYTAVGRLVSQFAGVPHHTEFYIAYDLLLNQADAPGTVAPAGDINHDAFVGLDDLNALLGNWNLGFVKEVVEGDYTGDGFVGIDDLNTVLSNWNASVTPGDLSQGDGNADGFVGIDDLNLVLIKWNTGVLPPKGPFVGDIDGDGVVGINDLSTLLSEWNVARPTTGIVPSYPLPTSDTQDITGEPEKLVWDMPASTNGDFTVALSLTVPKDGIDATWGEDTFKNGSTNYGSVFLDQDNRIELWHHRGAGIWSLEVTTNGQRAGVIKIPDAWLNVDGRMHWVISHDAQQGLSFTILHRGNEVASGSLPMTLPFMPTKMQIGSVDWLSVPTVGVLSAYYNPSVAETINEMEARVLEDAIYQPLPG